MPRKGMDRVIEALPMVLEKCSDVVYLIVGGVLTSEDEAFRQTLMQRVRELGLGDRVLCVGQVPPDELPLYYTTCDVFVLPNRETADSHGVEGFGIVFLEANACGKPVIGGRSGGVADAVVHGETGLLVNGEDVDEIADAIITLLSDTALAQRLGGQGRELVVREFSWERIIQCLRHLCYETADRACARAATPMA